MVRMTICPKTDQCVAVSLTTSPVTQVADVAVKSALPKDVGMPYREEMGSMSRIVPRQMRPAKPKMTILKEESFLLLGTTEATSHAPTKSH
jgi:hypothetical protein